MQETKHKSKFRKKGKKKEEARNKKRLREEQREELWDDVTQKKSLGAIKVLEKSKSFEKYTLVKERKIRRKIACFRLGAHMLEANVKNNKGRECAMCKKEERVNHWIKDCPALEELRKEMMIED